MKKYIYKLLLLCAVCSAASCATDDVDNSLGYGTEEVTNEELNTALRALGYNFDESGELICDDMVASTTELDLSDCGLKTAYGLAVFESLAKVDLSNNDFGESFNVRDLPESIQSITLVGNDSIIDYLGLVMKVSGTVPRENITTLMLPESAKWNMDELVQFAKTDVGAAATITIVNADGSQESYSYLRTVPNVPLKLKLREMYPSIFDETTGKIDLSKSIEEPVDLILDVAYDNLEGVEYIISNPSYQGLDGIVILRGSESSPYTMSYMRPTAKVVSLSLQNINTPNGIDLTDATELTTLRVDNNSSMETLELPDSFMGDTIGATNIFNNELSIENCAHLTAITLPAVGKSIGKIHLVNLPELKSLDLSKIEMIHTIALSQLSAVELTMPQNFTSFSDGWGGLATYPYLFLALDNEMEQSSTVQLFYTACAAEGVTITDLSFFYNI